MHIVVNKNKTRKRKTIYNSVLLRESYRENGKVKKRTIANLSRCSQGEIEAMQLALDHKNNLAVLENVSHVKTKQGLSVGAIFAIAEVARSIGIDRALGSDFQGQLAFWQICARVIAQGSRLSAVRLAQHHAACDVIGIRRGFDENDLYENLGWLADHQNAIEKSLFKFRYGNKKPTLFLYDVTSSYLEGLYNELGAYGYNRDKKKGKLQIVIGLLCDDEGIPIAVEVFKGNTQDTQTVASQVQKLAERFDCQDVTLVGDRGMLKRTQTDQLPTTFHYITAITKPQIKTLLETGVFQLERFQETICEVMDGNVRYVLKRNPIRAEEIKENRESKIRSIQRFIDNRNLYLKDHLHASIETAKRDVSKRIDKLGLGWCSLSVTDDKRITLVIDREKQDQESLLDGCYAIKTDLGQDIVNTEEIHQRYKDLANVEKAFRYCKTTLLEVRPIYVRNESHTRGHVLVVMLAYLIVQRLQSAWVSLDLTAEEGLVLLSTLSSVELSIKGKGECLSIPEPNEVNSLLLKKLSLVMPPVIPHKSVPVVTRKQLPPRRKNS